MGQKKPPIDTLGGGENRGGLLKERLDRYADATTRSNSMSRYITMIANRDAIATDLRYDPQQKKRLELANSLDHCGTWLTFHSYYTLPEDQRYRLAKADFCHRHTLCPLCSIRRSARYLSRYLDVFKEIMKDDDNLKAYFITFTVKNSDDLTERYDHLINSYNKLMQERRDYLKRGGKYNALCSTVAGIRSVEVKKGENSKLWHPHIHGIFISDEVIDQDRLQKEWLEITGDSHQVDVKYLYNDPVNSFLEVFKYSLAFTTMDLEDNWEAYEKLFGKRLVSSYGKFYGIKVDENKLDDLENDLPYMEILYHYRFGKYETFDIQHHESYNSTLKNEREFKERNELSEAKVARIRLQNERMINDEKYQKIKDRLAKIEETRKKYNIR